MVGVMSMLDLGWMDVVLHEGTELRLYLGIGLPRGCVYVYACTRLCVRACACVRGVGVVYVSMRVNKYFVSKQLSA